MRTKGFAGFGVFVLLYNLAVMGWGAYVRATGSGAGCGSHWPACNGEIVPRAASTETLIEFTHRATSGLALLLVIVQVWWARRAFAPGHRARRGATASLVLMIVEALLGAALVLFGWVADDASVARAVAMPVHLLNTFLLLGALSLTCAWSFGLPAPRPRGVVVTAGLGASLLAVAILGASGAVAALGDTLFPAGSLREGIAQDFAATSHFLLRIRVLHPFLAVAAGALLTFVAVAVPSRAPRPGVKPLAIGLVVLFVAQAGVGIVNLILLAPVALQLVHLVLADLVWIDLVLLAAAATAREATAAAEEPEATMAAA
jgi:cytochrome c oxidase assembly protein subunit 15